MLAFLLITAILAGTVCAKAFHRWLTRPQELSFLDLAARHPDIIELIDLAQPTTGSGYKWLDQFADRPSAGLTEMILTDPALGTPSQNGAGTSCASNPGGVPAALYENPRRMGGRAAGIIQVGHVHRSVQSGSRLRRNDP